MPAVIRSTWLVCARVLSSSRWPRLRAPPRATLSRPSVLEAAQAAHSRARLGRHLGVRRQDRAELPEAVRWAPDGRAFVAEKSGRILVYDSLDDTTPTVWADLRQRVHDFWDRGFLGMALDPQFADMPYVYAVYTYDKAPGSSEGPRRG